MSAAGAFSVIRDIVAMVPLARELIGDAVKAARAGDGEKAARLAREAADRQMLDALARGALNKHRGR